MIRYSVKYLDGIWRPATTNFISKEGEREYAKELVEMFKHFLYKGNILGYRVEISTSEDSDKPIAVIGLEEM